MSKHIKIACKRTGFGLAGILVTWLLLLSAQELGIAQLLPEQLTPPYALRYLNPAAYKPSTKPQTITVTIQVPSEGLLGNYLMTEVPPDGWTVDESSITTSRNEPGVWDEGCSIECTAVGNRVEKPCVKWGPFTDTNARNFTYKATIPANDFGDKTFFGVVFHGGGCFGVSGQTIIGGTTTTTSSIKGTTSTSLKTTTTTSLKGSTTTSIFFTTTSSTTTTSLFGQTTSTTNNIVTTTTFFGTTSTFPGNSTTSTSSPYVTTSSSTTGPTTTTSTTLPGPPLPDLKVTKTHSSEFRAGQDGIYYISVYNQPTARATATSVNLTDALPAGMSFRSGTGAGWECSNDRQVVLCTYGNALVPGQAAATLSLRVGVAAQVAVSNLINVVMVHPREGDADLSDNTDADTTSIQPLPTTSSTSSTSTSTTTSSSNGKTTTTKKTTTTTVRNTTTTTSRSSTTTSTNGPTTTTLPDIYISAAVSPTYGRYNQKTEFLVNLQVDMSLSGGRTLGAVTGELQWNPSILQLQAVVQDPSNGFTGYDNLNYINQGRLLFTATNPSGGEGTVNLRQVRFLTIGEFGSYSSLDLSFSMLTAAGSFENMLPLLMKLTAGQAVVLPSKRIGDVNCDFHINSLDALLIYQNEVQLNAPAGCLECGNADGDNDLRIDSTDANLIMSYDAGLFVHPQYPLGEECLTPKPNGAGVLATKAKKRATSGMIAGAGHLPSNRILSRQIGEFPGAGIKAYLSATGPEPSYMDKIVVEFFLDTTAVKKKIGSYTAVVSWDESMLRYMNNSPGSSKGLTQLVNRVGNKLYLTGGVVGGASGSLSLAKIEFEYLLGPGDETTVNLSIRSIASALVEGQLENLQSGLNVSSLTIREPYRVNFPRLIAGAVDENLNSLHTGIALVNLSPEESRLTFTAFDPLGSLIGGANIENPHTFSLPARHQMPRVEFQLFGEGILEEGKNTGWFHLKSSIQKMLGFFLIFDDKLQVLDGTEVTEQTYKSLIFTAVEEHGITQLNVNNPGAKPTNLTVELVRPDGVNKAAVIKPVAALGAVSESLSVLISASTASPADYFRVSSATTSISAVELLSYNGNYLTVLNGQDPDQAAEKLYAPQYVVGGSDWRSTLSIVNVDSKAGSVRLRLIQQDGTPIGEVRTLPVSAKGKLFINDQDFFVTAGSEMIQGYVEIIGNGIKLLGNIFFGDQNQQRFATTLPLASKLYQNLVFAHVASDDTYFMGLALINPNDAYATLDIRVFNREGGTLAQKMIILPSHQRQSLVLTEHFPELIGYPISSGFIVVSSDTPIAGYSVYGTHSLDVVSAVPAQPLPQ